MMKRHAQLILLNLAPYAVLVLGGLAAFVMFLFKTEPERVHHEFRGATVETMTASVEAHDLRLQAEGNVLPAQRITLHAQVGGRVIAVDDALVPGGRLAANTELVRIDARDYQLAVQASQADVNRAAVELQVERNRQRIATREWELFDSSSEQPDDGRTLALRQPHVETAQAMLGAAQSGFRHARLELERTTVIAPFDGIVVDEQVDVGQLVSPQVALATLVATDRYWVQVAIPIEAVSRIRIPDVNAAEGEGSPVRIRQAVADRVLAREGRVIRLFPSLDPIGRMARLLIEVDDPLGLADGSPDGLPLLLGSYVEVEIDAGRIESAIEVPRRAVHDGSHIFVMNAENRLEIREATFAWRDSDHVLVAEGLADGERVVVSRIGAPIEGMLLQVVPPLASADSPPQGTP